MIDSFLGLANDLGVKYSDSFKKIVVAADFNEEALITQLEKEFESNLFSYKFIIGEITEYTNITNPFVVSVGSSYLLIKYANGVHYNQKGGTNLKEYVGCRYFELREIVKIKSPDEMTSAIIDYTPAWSSLLLLLTPLILVTPVYTNIFNTRLVYSSSIVTLFVVSIFFFSVYALEFYAKKFIKSKCLKANADSALLCERYILKFTPYYRGFNSIHSIKTIEQYRKMIWDYIPIIASDTLSFLILFIALSVFVSWFSIYFFVFYSFVFGIFYFYRSRLYKHMVELDQSSNDVLKLRVSNTYQKHNIPFVNKFFLFKKYMNTFIGSQHSEDKISNFNFYWDELTKIVSFVALFILFVITFLGISNSELNPAYMLVLFIISSRLSGLITQIVTRLSYFKASLLHLHQSMEGFFDEEMVGDSIDNVGIKLENLNKIRVAGLTIKMEQNILLDNINLKLHKGILYGLKGSVGSGKSTLLRTLIGNNKNYNGKIEYDGMDLNVLDSSFFEGRVSYLTAETGFFSGSLYENFLFRNCNSNKIIELILKECFGNRIFDYQTLHLNDIETIPMSTGQRKKLLFMLSLLDSSLLYVFDEVLVNLTKKDITRAMHILKTKASRSIIILSSHNESILSACDEVYEIDNHIIRKADNL